MRSLSMVLPVILCVFLAGCLPRWLTQNQSPPPPPVAPPAPAKPSTGAPRPNHAPPRAPRKPDFDSFAIDGYEALVTGNSDIDGDGQDEWLVGYQLTEVNEIGEPQAPAYVLVLRREAGEWVIWTDVVPTNADTMVEESTFVRAGDLNEDGVPELILRFYGFGVSGRPVSVYVHHVLEDSVEPILQGGVADLTNKDGFDVKEVDASSPGPELLFAFRQPDDAPEYQAHPYACEAWGWTGSTYEYVSGETPAGTFESGDEALEAVYP